MRSGRRPALLGGGAGVPLERSRAPGPLDDARGEERQLQDEREPEAQADLRGFTLRPGGQRGQLAQRGFAQLPRRAQQGPHPRGAAEGMAPVGGQDHRGPLGPPGGRRRQDEPPAVGAQSVASCTP